MEHIKTFCRRYIFAVLLGLLIGVVGYVFHHAIEVATQFRLAHPWLLLCLPVGGAAIALVYHVCGMDHDKGTNQVLITLREDEPMRLRTAPLIFLSPTLTHLVGGSSGREGAALQLGASIASKISKTLRFEEHDSRIFTACGMAAGFSALFGTPLSAAVFSLEVLRIGVLQYAALVPALIASFTGYLVSTALGSHPTFYAVSDLPGVTPIAILQVTVLGIACGLVARLFCEAMHKAHHLYDRHLPNAYIRAAVGGLLVLALTAIVGLVHGGILSYPIYNGAGGELIGAATGGGDVAPWSFLLKILFTAVTLGAGFKGGEIVPAFATGATFGCTLAPLLGLSASFGGGAGMVALFCGVTNCPLTSILLAYELFGGAGLPLMALTIAVAYPASGYCSLYAQQSIAYCKNDLSERGVKI